MFPLVDAGVLLVVPVGDKAGPGKGLAEDLVRGSMLLQKPLVVGQLEAWWRAW